MFSRIVGLVAFGCGFVEGCVETMIERREEKKLEAFLTALQDWTEKQKADAERDNKAAWEQAEAQFEQDRYAVAERAFLEDEDDFMDATEGQQE